MITLIEIRAYIKTLPEVTEGPPVPAAHRMAAFKVAGKGFVGIEKGERFMTVSLSEDEAKTFADRTPEAYEEIWRLGQKFMGLRADLSILPKEQVFELIDCAWRNRAKG